jgi:hypothetical protein
LPPKQPIHALGKKTCTLPFSSIPVTQLTQKTLLPIRIELGMKKAGYRITTRHLNRQQH